MLLEQNMEFINSMDAEVGAAIQAEYKRQQDGIELIASENFASPAVMAAMGTVLTNKYAEGYPAKRYYGGCHCVDVVEELARKRACELFGADHANVQPHSGAQANMAVYFAFLKPGDTVLGMSLAHGGHLTHGSPVNMSGAFFNFVPYGVSAETGCIDYEELEKLAKENSPKLIVAGASAYPRTIDFERISKIAKSVGALFMVDMAHIAGLVAAGLHPSPVPYADIVTTTTHKTLRGPRGGMILCKEEYAKAIDKAIFPGTQGGPLEHIIAAKAVCFGEALKPEFKEYQKQVIANAKALEKKLLAEGINLVSGGTDNHLLLLDLRTNGITGKELEHRLDEVHITANKNAIPDDPEKPFVTSGIRIGAPAVTTRGFKEPEMELIGGWIKDVITDFEGNKERVLAEVLELCKKFPLYSGVSNMNMTLLKLLNKNARYSLEDLATMAGIPVEQAAADLDELEKEGIIRGYKPVIDWERVDVANVSALIELKVTPKAGRGFEEVAEKVMKYPEVESVYLMSGGYDLCVIVKGKTFQGVAMFVAKELSTLENVNSTAAHFVLRRYKELDVELCDAEPDDRGLFSL